MELLEKFLKKWMENVLKYFVNGFNNAFFQKFMDESVEDILKKSSKTSDTIHRTICAATLQDFHFLIDFFNTFTNSWGNPYRNFRKNPWTNL